MRLIFNLFLGWWLTQHRWMAEGQTCRPSSISVNPSNVVTVGQNIIISCKKEGNVKRTFIFCLYKGNVKINCEDTDHDEYEFRIINAQKSHQGQYRCICQSDSMRSYFSQTVDIYVQAQFYPSPSISAIPSGLVDLGKQVTIQCKREDYQDVLFTFFKKGALEQLAIPIAWNQRTGSLTLSAQESNGGIYFCDYRLHSYDTYSEFSNKIYINITAASLITLWTSTAAFLFLLAVLLLVLILILYKRRRKDAVTKESNVLPETFLNFPIEETPDEVSYAEINHSSLKIRPTAPESCVYATVS